MSVSREGRSFSNLFCSPQVGFFPSECVELINDKVPQSVTNSVPKPGTTKHSRTYTYLKSCWDSLSVPLLMSVLTIPKQLTSTAGHYKQLQLSKHHQETKHKVTLAVHMHSDSFQGCWAFEKMQVFVAVRY